MSKSMKNRDPIVAMLDQAADRMPELGHYLVVRDSIDLAREALEAIARPPHEWTAPDGTLFRKPLTPLQDAERMGQITAEFAARNDLLRAAGRPPLPEALGAFLRIRGYSLRAANEAFDAVIARGEWLSPDGKRFVAHGR